MTIEPIPFAIFVFHTSWNIVDKLLCRDRFFVFRSRTDPYWQTTPARRKIMVPKTYPILAMVKGMARMPDPITVLTMVITVRKKSTFYKKYWLWHHWQNWQRCSFILVSLHSANADGYLRPSGIKERCWRVIILLRSSCFLSSPWAFSSVFDSK